MNELRLTLRTPQGLLVDQSVESIVAEDLDGWFGLRPGHSDVVAALAPGLLVFRNATGEHYVALAGGLLKLRGEWCRVSAREAVVAQSLDTIAERVESLVQSRVQHRRAQEGVLFDLIREAQRRLLSEART